MRRLEGKRAIVTGGGSGIGRASAIRFAREGASVLVVGRSANTDETVEEIRAEGGAAIGMITDASVEENVAEIVRPLRRELGGLEVFFANIGVTGTNTPFLEQTVEEWAEVYRINTISCFLAIKYAGAHMTAQGYGSIILTSSAASLRANAGAISYSASKAAVNNLAQTAANAFAGTGVRVNAVLPGLVETQLTRAGLRGRPRARRRRQARPCHAAEAARPRGGDRGGGRVPGQRRFLLCRRATAFGGRRRQQHASLRTHRAAELKRVALDRDRTSSVRSADDNDGRRHGRGFRSAQGDHRQARRARRVHRGGDQAA